MTKPKPIAIVFEFDYVVAEVSMLSNHRDYRIWQAWFGKRGTSQRFWASFKLVKGVWFGQMAYYVVARTVVADLELVLKGVKIGSREPLFPKIQDLETYRQRLDALARMLDIYDQVPGMLAEVSHQDRIYAEDGAAGSSLHNARALILEKQLPSEVALSPRDDRRLYMHVTWSDTALNLYEHEFNGFTYGQFADLTYTMTFFRMLGYYMSEAEFRKVIFIQPRRGPKEWSPFTYKAILKLGEDYGKEDFQPGEHHL